MCRGDWGAVARHSRDLDLLERIQEEEDPEAYHGRREELGRARRRPDDVSWETPSRSSTGAQRPLLVVQPPNPRLDAAANRPRDPTAMSTDPPVDPGLPATTVVPPPSMGGAAGGGAANPPAEGLSYSEFVQLLKSEFDRRDAAAAQMYQGLQEVKGKMDGLVLNQTSAALSHMDVDVTAAGRRGWPGWGYAENAGRARIELPLAAGGSGRAGTLAQPVFGGANAGGMMGAVGSGAPAAGPANRVAGGGGGPPDDDDDDDGDRDNGGPRGQGPPLGPGHLGRGGAEQEARAGRTRIKPEIFKEDPEDPLVGEKFVAWRKRFLACVYANAWTEAEALCWVEFSIAYPASRHITGIDLHGQNLVQVLDTLSKAFMSPEAGQTAKADFKCARMAQSGENVLGWHTRARRLFIRAYPERDPETSKELIEQYVEGLYPLELAEWALDHQPRTFSEARDVAEAKAATLACKRRLKNLPYPQDTSSSAAQTAAAQGRQQQAGRAGVSAIQQGSAASGGAGAAAAVQSSANGGAAAPGGGKRRGPKCFNCKRYGHIRPNCPDPPRPRKDGGGTGQGGQSGAGRGQARSGVHAIGHADATAGAGGSVDPAGHSTSDGRAAEN